MNESKTSQGDRGDQIPRKLSEELLPFSKARLLAPPSPNGAARAPSTLWRWARRGVAGIRLRTVVIGRTAYTCEKWLWEFWEELTRMRFDTEDADADVIARRKSGRGSSQKHDSDVEAELDRMGITGRIPSRKKP